MSFSLPVGARLNDRYVIKKVIRFSALEGTYLARDDNITGRSYIIKEFIPPQMTENSLAERVHRCNQVIRSASDFNHPNLANIYEAFSDSGRAYVVMEYVEGLTLEAVITMSLTDLPDKQIIAWGLQICDALDYLHNRPRPFIFDVLGPTHVMILASDTVKLINFGLDRAFEPGAIRSVFAKGPLDQTADYVGLGRLLYYCVTRQMNADVNTPAPIGVNADLFKIIKRCLSQTVNPVYKDFKEVKTQLEAILNPPATEPTPREVLLARRRQRTQDLEEKVVGAVAVFLSQNPLIMALEVASFLVVLVWLGLWLNPGMTYSRQYGIPVGYVLTGSNELWAVGTGKQHKILDRRTIKDAAITSMKCVSNGQRLLLCDTHSDRIIVLDTATDDQVTQVRVDREPRNLTISPDGKTIYCLHGRTKNVSETSVDSMNLSNIIGVPHTPTDLAVAEDNTTVFVSMANQNAVINVDADTGRINATLELDHSPGALTVAPPAKELWVACPSANDIVVYDLSQPMTNRVPPMKMAIDLKGGREPVAMVLTPDSANMLVLSAENGAVEVVGMTDHLVHSTVSLGARILGWSMTPSQLWVALEGETSLAVVDLATNQRTDPVEVGKTPTLVEVCP